MGKKSNSGILEIKGQRRAIELQRYMAGLGARGLSKKQTRSVAAVYNELVLVPPLDEAMFAQALKAAREEVREERKHEHFKDLHTVEKKTAEFLLFPYIPQGSVTLLDGDPGMGKSLVTTHLAAMISTGGRFAGQEKMREGRVLFLAPEDEADRILRPRVEAHGADVSKIRFMDHPFLLDDSGIALLRREFQEYRPKIAIVDPLSAFIPPATDTFRSNEVRGFMRPLAMLAREMDLAILIVRHLRKSSTESAIQRGQGSMDFIASVRSGLIVAEHPQDPATRVLAQSKANYSMKGPSLAFEVKGNDRGSIPTIHWGGVIEQTADQLVQNGSKTLAIDDAAKMIKEVLSGGPITAKVATERLTGAGYSERTIDRAKELVGVIASRGPGAIWKLP